MSSEVSGFLILVGQAGGERAQRGQPIGALEVALELAQQRHVAEHADDAEVLALAALERRRAETSIGTELPFRRRSVSGTFAIGARLASVSVRRSLSSGVWAKSSVQ